MARLPKLGPLLFASLLGAFVSSSTYAADGDALRFEVPGHSVTLTLAELRKRLTPVTVEVDDPVFKATKRYDGFYLADVLRIVGLPDDVTADELVFTAKDGYAPNASFDDLRRLRPFLAFREHGKDGFEKITQGKEQLSPSPYYVVWTAKEPGLGEKVPWPYQLVKIEVVDFKSKYPKLYPTGTSANSNEMRGFNVYKAQCIRCHSINLQGGEIGPELNAPRNVTEYWSDANLRAFIRNPNSFRYKDKMPAFESVLRDGELDAVIAYLKAMKERKISAP